MTQKHNPDQAIAEMLKRKSAWPAAAAAEACPDADTLAAYFERSLTPAETSRWETHFSSCARCQEQLAALVFSERPTQPQFAGGEKRASWWLWNWRLLAPVGAAAVVVLAVVVSQQMMRAPTRPASSELMAKREASSPAPTTAEPQRPTEAAASPKAETGRVAVDELRGQKVKPGEAQTRSNLPPPAKPADKSVVAEDTQAFAMRQPSDRNQVGVAPPQAPSAQQGVPATVVTAPAETVKTQPQAAQANRPAAAPAAAQAETITVEAIQKQERAAKVAEEKERADHAISAVQLKRDTAAGKQEGAATQQAPARFGLRARAEVPGQPLLMAPSEFLVTTPNPKILWRFGAPGLIEQSRDAGRTWERKKSPTQELFLAGSAPSDKVCWVGGKNGILLRTTDGGETWETILSPTQNDIVAVKALDHLGATVADADGRTYETLSAGRVWRTP